MMTNIIRNPNIHSDFTSSNDCIKPSSEVPYSNNFNNAYDNYDDYYVFQQGYAQCCFINVLVFFCMTVGLYCLFSYDYQNIAIVAKFNNSKIFNLTNIANYSYV